MPTNKSNGLKINRPVGLNNTTNLAWQYTDLDICPPISDTAKIFNLLFHEANGYVKIGQYINHDFYDTNALRDPFKVSAIIGSRKYKRNNTVFSICTYRNNKDGSQKNIATINAVVIDIDYQASSSSEIANLPVNEAVRTFISYFLLDEIIPLPTYIEVGCNFKLVYILDHPFIIPKTVAKKKRESIFTFFRRIIQVISETIQNAGCGDWGVDTAYKIAPYLRVPESYNVKWDESDFKFTHKSQFKNMFNPDFEKGFQPKSVDEVYISEFSNWNTWDIDKLADTVLPPIDESWYYDYKEKQNKKPKQKKPTVQKLYSKNLFKQRMEDLESLQSLGWDVGYREFMIYLYRLSAHLSGMSLDDEIKAAQQFNSKFKQPLHPHRVETQCKPSDYNQKFKNTTIREQLGLSENDYPHLFEGDGISRHERYEQTKQQKIKSGALKTKSQKLEETYQQIIELQKQGYKRKDIEEQLGIPHRTMTRYINTIKERNNDN